MEALKKRYSRFVLFLFKTLLGAISRVVVEDRSFEERNAKCSNVTAVHD